MIIKEVDYKKNWPVFSFVHFGCFLGIDFHGFMFLFIPPYKWSSSWDRWLKEYYWSHVPLAQIWTRNNVGWTQASIFCKVNLYPIARSFQQHQRHIITILLLELNGRHSSVTMSSMDFSFQNLVFWNLFGFSLAEIT